MQSFTVHRRALWGLLGMMALLLIPLRVYNPLPAATPIPTWPVPTPYQASAKDWVQVAVVSPVGALSTTTPAIVLQVNYHLTAAAEADLVLELRSALDLDRVDLGSDWANVLTQTVQRVPQGNGEFTVQWALNSALLNKFPAGSALWPLASLRNTQAPAERYFHQVFTALAWQVPDFVAACDLPREKVELEVREAIPPVGGQFSAAAPRAQVTLRYTLPTTHPELFTLLVGLANPAWAGQAPTVTDWQKQVGSYTYQALTAASGHATFDLYAWYPNETNRHIPNAQGEVALAVAVVCGYEAYHPATVVHTQVFPAQHWPFAPELLGELAPTPTLVPSVTP